MSVQTRSPTNHTNEFIYRFIDSTSYTPTGLSSTLHFYSLPVENLNWSTHLPTYLMHTFNRWEPFASTLFQLTGWHLYHSIFCMCTGKIPSTSVAPNFISILAKFSVCSCSNFAFFINRLVLLSTSLSKWQTYPSFSVPTTHHVHPTDPVHITDFMHLR